MIQEKDVNFSVNQNSLCLRFLEVEKAIEKIKENTSLNEDIAFKLLDELHKEYDFILDIFNKNLSNGD